MEKNGVKRSRLEFEYVPELLQRVQSLLPPKEATRTCIVSKSWLHAWSTIPTLRFTKPLNTQQQHQQLQHEDEEEEDDKYIHSIDHTLRRYKRENIPLQSLDLLLSIENQRSLSLLEVWIPLISSKSCCLKELSLRIWVKDIKAVTLPEEIFAGESLNMISIKIDDESNPLSISQHPVIKCFSLRVLELELVDISEEVLNNLFSTCKLLEKINLVFSIRFLGTIKVKNLRYLRELRLKFEEKHDILEVDDVPSLALFHYEYSGFNHRMHPFPFHMNVLESVKELCFGGAVANNSLPKMIISKFPFLESLDLIFGRWGRKSFVITSHSLKRLTLQFLDNRRIRIKVNAPKLLYFCYVGDEAPRLLFPVIVPKQIKLRIMMSHRYPVDVSSFLKIREALDLPSVFDIDVLDETWPISEPLNIVDDLRRKVALPAMSVQQLSLKIRLSNLLWDFSSFFGAYFSICHPSYVKLYQDDPFEDKNSIYMLLVKGLTENKSTKRYWSNLKDVKIINPHGESNSVDFQLNW